LIDGTGEIFEPIMTDGALQLLFSDLLDTIDHKKKFQVTAVFYQTKSIRHTIQLKHKHIRIKIAHSFREAPEHIIKILGLILYSKLFRFKIDTQTRRTYRQYVDDTVLPNHITPARKPSKNYRAQGNYYNLDHIFDVINQFYFQSQLKKPFLGWSLHKSYTRLGFYAEDKNLLVISRIFDSPRVPGNVVEYMMYHEMLHIAMPSKTLNGRRRIHPPEFKKMDKAFPDYDEIQKWIKKNRIRL